MLSWSDGATMAVTQRMILSRPACLATRWAVQCARVLRPVMNPRSMQLRADAAFSVESGEDFLLRHVSAAPSKVRKLGTT